MSHTQRSSRALFVSLFVFTALVAAALFAPRLWGAGAQVTLGDPQILPGDSAPAVAAGAQNQAQLSRGGAHDTKSLIFFAGIDKVRFRRQVVPGDQLVLEAEVIRIVRGIGKFNARALVDGELAAEGELLAAVRPAGGASSA